MGVNFSNWPDLEIFKQAKQFWKVSQEKSHNAACVQVAVEIPDDDFLNEARIDEVKIYYTNYLKFLKAIELSQLLRKKPEQADVLCETFLKQKNNTSKYNSISDLVASFVEENEKKINEGVVQVNLSEFPETSKIISGFNKGRVTIITAYSGFGKTNLGLNFLRSIIKDGYSSVYFNMEMESFDVTKRFLQANCKVNSWEFLNKDYIQKISNVFDLKKQLEKNYITDGSSLSISEIKSVITDITKEHKLDFAIVDYDQKIIMDDSGIKEEWQYIKKAVEMLEAIAKSEMIHVIMFAQTNEESEGAPIASRRSIQPASSVIHFTKENDISMFKFLKNRFGSTSEKVKLNYDQSKSLISENGLVVDAVTAPIFKKNYGVR